MRIIESLLSKFIHFLIFRLQMTFATSTTTTNQHIYSDRLVAVATWFVRNPAAISSLYLSFVILNLPKFVCRKIPVNAFAPVTFTNLLQQNNKNFNLLYPNDLWQSLFRLFISTLIEIILFVSFIPSHLLLPHPLVLYALCHLSLVPANSTAMSSNFSSTGGGVGASIVFRFDLFVCPPICVCDLFGDYLT